MKLDRTELTEEEGAQVLVNVKIPPKLFPQLANIYYREENLRCPTDLINYAFFVFHDVWWQKIHGKRIGFLTGIDGGQVICPRFNKLNY